MSKKSAKVSTLLKKFSGRPGLDPHYAVFFELFNEGLFYESHDVLEQLWLKQKKKPNFEFYKALIQLAGAFVHLQKERLQPAAALFRLSQGYLGKYPDQHELLDVAAVRAEIKKWLSYLESHSFQMNPLKEFAPPRIVLHFGF